MTVTTSAESLASAVAQIDAGVLNVGYVDAGPPDGPAVLLLHGWPYDIHSYADVVPLLTARGYRVIVPHLRGYGTTRFLSESTARNGEQAALALDAIALLDALAIDRAVVAGFDWGARTANIVAALWPERCTGLVSVSGYLIGSQAAGADLTRSMAERAGATITELDGSHVIMVSQPQAVTDVILEAVAAVAAPAEQVGA